MLGKHHHIIFGNKSGEVKLWNLSKASGELIVQHDNEIVVIAEYRSFIITGSLQKTGDGAKPERKTLRIYSSENCCCLLFKKAVNENIHSIAVSEPAKILAIGTVDRFIYIYNLKELSADSPPIQVRYFKSNHTDLILSLVIVPSKYLHPNKGQEAAETNQHIGELIDFHIVSVGWDKRISVWPINGESGKKEKMTPFREFSRGHRNAITTAVFFELDLYRGEKMPIFITGSLDKTVIIWNYAKGQKIKSLVGHEGKINAVRVVPQTRDLDLTSFTTHSPNKAFNGTTKKFVLQDRFPLIVTASDDKTIRLWDFRSGENIRTIQFTEALPTLNVVKNDKGLQVISSSKTSGLLIWNLCNYRTITTYETAPVTAIDVYNKDGKECVLIGAVDDKISLYPLNDSNQAKVGETFGRHQRRINAAVVYTPTVPPNQSAIAASCDGAGKLLIWRPHLNYQDNNNEPITCHSDTEVPVTLTLAIYDPYLYGRTTKPDARPLNKSHTVKVDLSQACILTGGGDWDIKIWDLDGNYKDKIDKAHQLNVRSIVIYHPVSPSESPLFLSGSYDKTAKLWDLQTLTLLCTFEGYHTNYVFFTAIYDPHTQFIHPPQGATSDPLYHEKTTPAIITSSYDRSFAIWDMPSVNPASSWVAKIEKKPRLPKEDKEGNPGPRFVHDDSITALAVYTPAEGDESPPMVITGSIDQLIHLWNLFTGEKLQTLVGHIDRVCWIKVYQPLDKTRSAMILSGGDDGKTILWEDSLYYQRYLPLAVDVKRCFKVDVLFSSRSWPLIDALAEMFKEQLFFSHSYLFYLAILFGQSEFLIHFEHYFEKVFLSLSSYQRQVNDESVETGDLLTLAIRLKDDRAVHLIVKQWIKHLSLDIEDLLSLQYYHAMHLFPYDCLHNLLEYYPSEFGHLIQSLKVIPYFIGESTMRAVDFKIHKSKVREPVIGKFHKEREVLEIVAEQQDQNQKIDEKAEERPPITRDEDILVLSLKELGESLTDVRPMDKLAIEGFRYLKQHLFPIDQASTVKGILPFLFEVKNHRSSTTDTAYELLEMILCYAERTDNDGIFQCEACEVLIDYCWESRGRAVHIIASVKYLIFLIIFTIATYLYTPHRVYKPPTVAFIFGIFSLIGFVWHGKDEFSQFLRTWRKIWNSSEERCWTILYRTTWSHLYDRWNILDVITIVSGIVGLVLRFLFNTDTPTERSFLAIASVLMWFKFVYFLRPFPLTGPLVAMVIEVTLQIQLYLVLLFCVLAGYAQAFWTLSNDTGLVYKSPIANDDPGPPFGTISQAFYNAFFYMLGQNIDTEFPRSTGSPYIASIFLVSFMMVMMILMFNLLIALMGDICTKIREKGSAQWRKEQAGVLLEERFLMSEAAIALDRRILVNYKG